MVVVDEIVAAARAGTFGILLERDSVLIPAFHVNNFLDWISGKYSLLGVEGFTYDGRNLTPLMDCIIDYSQGDPSKSVEFHRQILSDSSFQKAQFLEFTIGKPIE